MERAYRVIHLDMLNKVIELIVAVDEATARTVLEAKFGI